MHTQVLIIGGGPAGLLLSQLLHRQQRDGAAWELEWHALPQVCMATNKLARDYFGNGHR